MLTEDIKKIAQDFITENSLGTLGTVDQYGQPWGAVVYFGCDDNFNLYFTTKSETLKHQNIAQNPAISVVFANEENQITVQVRGTARLVLNNLEANSAADALTHAATKSRDWIPPLSKLDAGSYQLYKIQVNYARLSGFGDKRAGEEPDIIEYTPKEN